MAEPWQSSLDRWRQAGLLDEATVDRVRAYEAATPRSGSRWAVWISVALGSITVATGIFLFVAAHWDELSPMVRLFVVFTLVGGFHAAGVMSRASGLFRMAFHGLGTASLGAGIALAGQVFHLEEHWSGGALLWLLGALAGWLLLRDWPQMTLLALLAPAWVIAEYSKHETRPESIAAGFLLFLAIVYSGSDELPLRWIGAVAMLPAFFVVALEYRYFWLHWPWPWAFGLALPFALSLLLDRRDWWRYLAAAVWIVIFAALAAYGWKVGWHAWGALGWIALVSWGVSRLRADRINIGVAGFAGTILSFYFANVMDRLGRSLSLIALGGLLLGGGWLLERLRRRLVREVEA